VNNPSIPSMHAIRKITTLSGKLSFTLHPSLSPYGQTELQTESQIHSRCVGWRNLFFSCAVCCVSFWFWRKKGFGSNMHVLLRVQYSCGGVLIFLLQLEIVFGVLHILSVQYSCAVVSVFGCSGK
jgi:hypothetical protein